MLLPSKAFTCLLLFFLAGETWAGYSFKVVVKFPFPAYDKDSLSYDPDSLVRGRPLKMIIHRSEAESLYQEEKTNDSGSTRFSFSTWGDSTPVIKEDIVEMTIDFPNTERVIQNGGDVTFEHLIYHNVNFQQDSTIITLPTTVTVDYVDIGNSAWPLSFTFGAVADLHIGDGWRDFHTSGWNDVCSHPWPGSGLIGNCKYALKKVSDLYPDFVVVDGDLTNSAERTEIVLVREILSGGLREPSLSCYIPLMGNHDIHPFWAETPLWGDEARIPEDCYLGQYF